MKITHSRKYDKGEGIIGKQPLHRTTIKYFIDGDMIEAFIQQEWNYRKYYGMDKFLKELGSPKKIKDSIKSRLASSGRDWFDTMGGEINYEDEATQIAKKLFPQFYK